MKDVCNHRNENGNLSIEYDDSYEMRTSDMHCIQCGMHGSRDELASTPFIRRQKFEIKIYEKMEDNKKNDKVYEETYYVIARDIAEAQSFLDVLKPKLDKINTRIVIRTYLEFKIKFWELKDIERMKSSK